MHKCEYYCQSAPADKAKFPCRVFLLVLLILIVPLCP
jgi:hypothetical protein